MNNYTPIRIELPTLFQMGTVNSYLIKDPEPVLIDCGENTDAAWHALVKGIENENLSIKDISRVIITHPHVDHIGMAKRVAEAAEAKVWVSTLCYDWAHNKDLKWKERQDAMTSLFRKLFYSDNEIMTMFATFVKTISSADTWQTIPKSYLEVFDIGDNLDMGNSSWEVIYAPGHSNTQTVFYSESINSLLAADMLLKITPTPVLEVDPAEPEKRERGLPILLESYDKMRQLDIIKTYPGHYEIMGDPTALIDHQKGRIRQRANQTLELIKSGTSDFSTLFKKVYPGRLHPPAMNMLLGYLDLLEMEGKVTWRETEKEIEFLAN